MHHSALEQQEHLHIDSRGTPGANPGLKLYPSIENCFTLQRTLWNQK